MRKQDKFYAVVFGLYIVTYAIMISGNVRL